MAPNRQPGIEGSIPSGEWLNFTDFKADDFDDLSIFDDYCLNYILVWDESFGIEEVEIEYIRGGFLETERRLYSKFMFIPKPV